MNFQRSSGILLHPTSLPGPYGIGDLGPEAFRFVDFLADSGTRLWQVLPLGPTGYGDSPYQCFSAFAGNPYLISPDFLLRDNFLHPNDLIEKTTFSTRRVDFGRIIPWKLNLLERAYLRFISDPGPAHRDFKIFCADESSWLDDYALFMSIKESHGGGAWDGWPASLRNREPSALAQARTDLVDAIERYKFYQFLFFKQWNALRAHANSRGIKIIGDIPIFVAYDSADAWANPELFFLDENGRPTVVAGVPPDGFSPDGQLWGNPLYNWPKHKETGFAWWLARFRATLAQVDIIRLDHFRGFAGYYEIPARDTTARNGRWMPALGAELFVVMKQALGELPIIAEDLGLITEDVVAIRDGNGFPGMRILQFAFSGPDNNFLPHHFSQNCVVYTGVHDNDTTRSWYETTSEHEREFANRYFGNTKSPMSAKEFVTRLIRAAWSSVAVFAVVPMQDFLSLGGEARFNYPSRLGGNWDWRMDASALTDQLRDRIRELNYL
ncbi:MAG TPA: 4-alpha-glucanotransferase, partial [Anaerolineales bacterium]|nr:4-alpha-glucanotransferase [Anaerolineales bacterium]